MIAMLVGRCHVGDTNREVLSYVVSCLKKGSWEALPSLTRRSVIRECLNEHKENRKLYRAVMTGSF